MIIEIIVIFFLLLLSAFFSSSETAITKISDAKIHQWDEKKNKKIIKAKSLLKNREKVIECCNKIKELDPKNKSLFEIEEELKKI